MVPLNEASRYHINVHDSRTYMGNLVALGDPDD